MTRRLEFHEDAVSEIRAAARWYDDQQHGLGDDFLAALKTRLDGLILDPSLSGRVQGLPPELPIRRVLLERFPYAVIFIEGTDAIQVVAVVHGRRRPRYWLQRVDGEDI